MTSIMEPGDHLDDRVINLFLEIISSTRDDYFKHINIPIGVILKPIVIISMSTNKELQQPKRQYTKSFKLRTSTPKNTYFRKQSFRKMNSGR